MAWEDILKWGTGPANYDLWKWVRSFSKEQWILFAEAIEEEYKDEREYLDDSEVVDIISAIPELGDSYSAAKEALNKILFDPLEFDGEARELEWVASAIWRNTPEKDRKYPTKGSPYFP